MDNTWRKSTFSQASNCVEARCGPDGRVAVRDSRDPDGLVMTFGPASWREFLRGVAAGEFDTPPGNDG